MGEGSAKSLRGGAMDDVIFAGTEKRPSRDFAEVSILTERDASHEERELEIVRRIERGAGSAYRINGKDVRAKDVSLVFADAATGAHSPALVSQGRIGMVIAAKPVDRRAMLEEAAGISGLHVRRKDAEQKLRATENNLNRLNEILADMENRAGTLRRQARAAERYRKLSTDIRIAEGRMIFARWRDAAAAADKANVFLEQDLNERNQIASKNTVFAAPEPLITQLSDLKFELSQETQISENLSRIAISDSRTIEIDRILQTVPSDDTVIPLLEERAKNQATLDLIVTMLINLDTKIAELKGKTERLQSRYQKVLAEEADAKIKDLDQKRSRDFATKAISTVNELAKKTMMNNISLIEVAILEKLGVLFGKEKLITDLRINPETLEVAISTGEEIDLPVDRLSAGERQLLAVATLWGLSSVAGHPLPLVIDTPLGRLDSEHRKRIVNNYFPHASAQVLILSTDEEIVEDLHSILQSSISHEYIIEYSEETASSSIREGYFVRTSNGS